MFCLAQQTRGRGGAGSLLRMDKQTSPHPACFTRLAMHMRVYFSHSHLALSELHRFQKWPIILSCFIIIYCIHISGKGALRRAQQCKCIFKLKYFFSSEPFQGSLLVRFDLNSTGMGFPLANTAWLVLQGIANEVNAFSTLLRPKL